MGEVNDNRSNINGANDGTVENLHTFALSKAHKLAKALYLVSNLLKDEEPLKWRLRGEVLNILQVLFEGQAIEDELGQSLDAFGVLLDVARQTRALSDMNVDILEDEVMSLKKILEKDKADLLLPSDFFDVTDMHINDIQNDTQNDTEIRAEKPQTQKAKKSTDTTFSDRKARILRLIREHEETTISDIKRVIKGCSEKTLQRDLAALIKAGKIKREGKRRWAKYLPL